MSVSPQKKWIAAFIILAMVLVMATVFGVGCNDGETTTDGDVQEDGEVTTRLKWPTTYRDLRRTGRCDNDGPSTNDVKWTYEAGAQTRSWSVLDMDGNVLAGFEGKLVNVDPENGSLNWDFSTAGNQATTPNVAEDGTICFSAGGSVYALTPEGEEIWSYDVGGEADGPTVGSDGTVFVGSDSGRLVALSSDGELQWDYDAGGDIRSPSIDDDGNLYCGAQPLVLYALDKEGNELWEFRPEGELAIYEDMWAYTNSLDVPSIGDDGTIYAGSHASPGITTGGQFIEGYTGPEQAKVYAVTPQGQKIWEYAHPQGPSTIYTPSIGHDGTLYSGTSIWRVLALDPDGSLIWEFNIGEDQTVCPTVYSPSIGTDGLLYSATTCAKMFCITPQGTEQWRYEAGEPWLPGMGGSNNLTPPPIGTDGTLFSVLAEGKIFAWKTGAVQQDDGEQPPSDDMPPPPDDMPPPPDDMPPPPDDRPQPPSP